MSRSKELMSNFYDSIKDNYPDLSKEECDLMCRSVFKLIYFVISSGSQANIMLSNFGSFVFNGEKGLEFFRNDVEQKFKNGKISANKKEELLKRLDKWWNIESIV